MPGVLILLPPALLVVGGLLTWVMPSLGVQPRIPGVAATWAALAALVGTWFAVGRLPTTLGVVLRAVTLPPLVQLDATVFAAGVILLSAVALLVTLRPVPAAGTVVSGLGTLATACALLAIEAGSLALLAVSVGAACLLLIAAHRDEGGRLLGGLRPALMVATLALLGAAAVVLAGGGTTVYSAVPVAAFSGPPFLLVVAAAACLCGLMPWPCWVSECLGRSRDGASGMTLVLLTPVGLFLLLQTTQLGAGTWPAGTLRVIVPIWAALSLIAAGLRAQAAHTRRRVLRELALMQVAVAAIALSLASRLGIAAGITGLAAATLGQLTSLILPTGGRLGILGGALGAAVPPGLAFAALALTAEASLQVGGAGQLLVLVLGGAFVLGLAAVARASRLAVGPGGTLPAGVVAIAVALASGALIGPFQLAIALPAAAEVMPNPTAPAPLTVTAGDIVGATGGWGALALGGLALIFAAALPLTTHAVRADSMVEPEPPPFLSLPAPTPADGLRRLAARLRLTAAGWDRALERLQSASERGTIWLWAAIAFVLAIVVTR